MRSVALWGGVLEALHSHRFGRRRPEAARIGRPFVLLAAVHVWTTLVGYGYARVGSPATAWPSAPILFAALVTSVLGFGLPAAARVHLRLSCGARLCDLPGGGVRAGPRSVRARFPWGSFEK